jgi:hypothetical protein
VSGKVFRAICPFRGENLLGSFRLLGKNTHIYNCRFLLPLKKIRPIYQENQANLRSSGISKLLPYHHQCTIMPTEESTKPINKASSI